MIVGTLFVLIMTFRLSHTENRDDWIDPNDMLNFDPSTNTMKKNKVIIPDLKVTTTTQAPPVALTVDSEDSPICESSPPCKDCSPCPECRCEEIERACPEPVMCPPCHCGPPKECICEQAALPLLRKYISTVLTHLGDQAPVGGKEEFTFHISLSSDSVLLFEKFVKDGNQKHVHDIHEILGSMIDRVVTDRLGRLEKAVLWLENKIGLKLDRLVQFFMLGALASVMLLIEIRLQIAWRRRISQIIVLMFVISVPWTWIELYKHAEIKQQTMATRKIPQECKTGEQDYWAVLKSYFTLQDDKCHEYHEHLLIDPLLKVPPTKAIAVTFVRFFVAPLKDVGSSLSEFIRALLIDLPLTLYPVAIVIVALFLFMFLFMWFGYSIRLPFFLTIERSPQLSVADSQLHQAIQENSQQTLSQLEKLQARLESTESELADKLRNLQRIQQAAIEYTMSSTPASPEPSPSISRSEVKSQGASPSISRSEVKESPHNTRSGAKKKLETKVRAAPESPRSKNITVPFDAVDSKGVQDIEDLDSGEPNHNGDVISDTKNRQDGARNRNDNDASISKDEGNIASDKAEQCLKYEIDTLKPDGSRD